MSVFEAGFFDAGAIVEDQCQARCACRVELQRDASLLQRAFTAGGGGARLCIRTATRPRSCTTPCLEMLAPDGA